MTGIFRYIHSALFWLSVLLYTVVIHVVFCGIALFIRGEEKKIAFFGKGARLWGSLLTNASGVKVKILGLENIPGNTNVIFTPNHQSYLDIFILLKYLPQPFKFVIMRGLFNVPVIGSYITRSGFISLDRKDRKRSIKTIHLIIDLLKSGESFIIFPEGRLTKDGNIGEFGRGASVIIQRSRKPVVPIAIDGTFGALPKGAWKLSPAEVRVKIGKPVYFEDHYGEVNKETSYKLSDELRGIVAGLKG